MPADQNERPIAIEAATSPLRTKPTNYPQPFAARMSGRLKRPLGDRFGLAAFGVNLTTLLPGGISSLRHKHTLQEEFIYVLEGELVLVTDGGVETQLRPGMCAGFVPSGGAHHIVNRGQVEASYLEIGDRRPNDEVSYPDDDIQSVLGPDGQWRFSRKDGTPY